jgi:putative transposase
MQALHVQQSSVPAPYNKRRIPVGMVGVTTGDATKSRLAFARACVNDTTCSTRLGTIGRVHFDHLTAALLHLVGEDQVERAPTLIQNGTVEPGLLPDHAPRIVHGARGRGGHVLDAEVFQHGNAEPLGNVERGAVVEVAADAPRTPLKPGDTAALSGIATRTPPATRQDALRAALRRLDPIQARGHGHHLAGRKGKGRRYAPVDTHGRPEVLQRLALNRAGEGDVPSVRPARDGRVLDRALDRAGIAELHPADLRQADGAPLPVQAAGLNFATGEAEGVADALFARGRVAGASCEEVPEGAVQVAKGLLLAGHVDGPDPVELGPKIGQLSGLGDVVEPLSGLPLVVPPPIPALFQREVVDEAADARELAEQSFLFSGRAELEAIAAGEHPETLQVGLRSRNVEIRRGRHVVYDLHAHLVFVTKYRRDVLSALAIRDLSGIFAKVCRDFEAELVACSGEDDHVHLLVRYPPKVALSKLVNSLKGVSSRRLRETRPEVSGRYHDGVLWSASYFAASCGGAPLSVIAEYVRTQRKDALPPRPERRGLRAQKR